MRLDVVNIPAISDKLHSGTLALNKVKARMHLDIRLAVVIFGWIFLTGKSNKITWSGNCNLSFFGTDELQKEMAIQRYCGRSMRCWWRGVQDHPAGVHQLPNHLRRDNGGTHPHQKRTFRWVLAKLWPRTGLIPSDLVLAKLLGYFWRSFILPPYFLPRFSDLIAYSWDCWLMN